MKTENMTNYAGINYAGIGSTVNMDASAGIRYGIISSHKINPDALEDIFSNGEDLDYANFVQTIKDGIKSALSDYVSPRKLDDLSESAFDAISDDLDYESCGDSVRMEYVKDGYKILSDSSGDIWVMESPFYTYAQFCSPCAPGACYLSSPLESPLASNKCYCLGSDWFDTDSPCPYPVYSVETGKLV